MDVLSIVLLILAIVALALATFGHSISGRINLFPAGVLLALLAFALPVLTAAL